MIPMALKVVEAVDALNEASCGETGVVAGRVRLTVPAPLGLYLSDRLAALLARHPGLSVEMLFREEPSELVGEGIDLEVRLGPVSEGGLICRRIGWTTAFLVAAPDYLNRRPAPKISTTSGSMNASATAAPATAASGRFPTAPATFSCASRPGLSPTVPWPCIARCSPATALRSSPISWPARTSRLAAWSTSCRHSRRRACRSASSIPRAETCRYACAPFSISLSRWSGKTR